MIRLLIITTLLTIISAKNLLATPIISGISNNEINIDTNFQGTKILLFGAKGYAGDIVITIRGPKKDFIVTKKQKLLGLWHNGKRVKFEDTYSLYSLFSTFNNIPASDKLLSKLELGKSNLSFKTKKNIDEKIASEFKAQLINQLEERDLYHLSTNEIEFLDETLFKVIIDFPKNISRGVYTAEIYLINNENLLSFQSIPIYVNQVGLSGRVLDFAYEQSFLYGLLAVALALIIGYLTNVISVKLFSK
ncbi:MAG: TIGR02186 family protein [Rickettsiales bacterium]|nr:TIGR02186 family protein [Rickettsiales bacterium]